MSRPLLGRILQDRGLDDEPLRQALHLQQREPGTRLGVALVQLGAVTEEDVAEALAVQSGLAYVALESIRLDPALLWKLGQRLAERHQVVPLTEERGEVRVAMADPRNLDAIRDLEFALKARIAPVVSSPRQIRRAIRLHYGAEAMAARLLAGVPAELRSMAVAPTSLDLDPARLADHVQRGGHRSYTDLLDFLLINAIERGASDVHLEPQPTGVRVRMRIDGMLRETLLLPEWAADGLASRIKVIGQMDVTERRRPQDGQSTARYGGYEFQLRLAVMPSQHGESVVIRVLDARVIRASLSDLGWSDHALKAWYRLLAKPRGLLLAVGPTGSGKSTTLYASIHRLNQETASIVTIEDPVEYSLDGITQVQVNDKVGITFASSLKAMLRQDPNIVVIGEIRDAETAGAAAEASTTGHLVLSTLHTGTAVGAITRLSDLDVVPYMLGTAIAGVVSQRLVRKVCPDCSLPHQPTDEDFARIGIPPVTLEGDVRRPGGGCPVCQYSGYAGRVGIYELLVASNAFGELVQAGATESDLWEQAHADGLVPLIVDGLEKVRTAQTTLEELSRVVSVTDYPPAVLAKALGVAVPEAPLAASSAARAPEPAEPAKMERRRERPLVLIADDAEEILQVVELTLEDDFDVIKAADGVEALEQAAYHQPDLIVLDVMMPRKTGYEVCEALKVNEQTASVPVLMLSARGEKAHVKEGFHAGADDYLPKPFDPEELLLRARALARRSGWRDL